MQLLVCTEARDVPDSFLLELSFTVLSHVFINLYNDFKVILKFSCNIAAQKFFILFGFFFVIIELLGMLCFLKQSTFFLPPRHSLDNSWITGGHHTSCHNCNVPRCCLSTPLAFMTQFKKVREVCGKSQVPVAGEPDLLDYRDVGHSRSLRNT